MTYFAPVTEVACGETSNAMRSELRRLRGHQCLASVLFVCPAGLFVPTNRAGLALRAGSACNEFAQPCLDDGALVRLGEFGATAMLAIRTALVTSNLNPFETVIKHRS
jgi:hypothetical protein